MIDEMRSLACRSACSFVTVLERLNQTTFSHYSLEDLLRGRNTSKSTTALVRVHYSLITHQLRKQYINY
jgi:hypothetical protein